MQAVDFTGLSAGTVFLSARYCRSFNNLEDGAGKMTAGPGVSHTLRRKIFAALRGAVRRRFSRSARAGRVLLDKRQAGGPGDANARYGKDLLPRAADRHGSFSAKDDRRQSSCQCMSKRHGKRHVRGIYR